MSNTATNQVEETIIPADDDIPTPHGSRLVWRIADGEIRTGREADGSLQVKEKIVGRLRRIGIFFGTSKDTGEEYGQLEADIETADGMTRVKCGITEKGTGKLQPSVAALSFAEGLLDIAKDELFVVTANLASKPNRFGKFSTYANLYHLDGLTKRTKETARLPRSDKSMDERWEDLATSLRDHPAFADRPASDSDDDAGNATTHLSALCKECEAKGIPTPEQAPAEWLLLMQAFMEESAPRATLGNWDDDTWGRVRQETQDLTDCPEILLPAKERLAKGNKGAFK
jgi:hypothetical protein